jgi:phosphate:Na+ symporter
MTMTASRTLPYVLLATGFVVFSTVFAQQGPAEAQEVDWLQLGMGLFGGLALFLGGLDLLSEGLKKAAGNTLRTILQKLTVNRFM